MLEIVVADCSMRPALPYLDKRPLLVRPFSEIINETAELLHKTERQRDKDRERGRQRQREGARMRQREREEE
jgi:hypothetical protein